MLGPTFSLLQLNLPLPSPYVALRRPALTYLNLLYPTSALPLPTLIDLPTFLRVVRSKRLRIIRQETRQS